MVRVRYRLDDPRQIAKPGRTYSIRAVSFVIDCCKSTVSRYVRAFSEPLPDRVATRIGRPPRLSQDDLALTETIPNANRNTPEWSTSFPSSTMPGLSSQSLPCAES